MTIQQLADIAARHLTRMADAMIAACVARAVETGEPLVVPERGATASIVGARPVERADWERLVRGNSDTRRLHC